MNPTRLRTLLGLGLLIVLAFGLRNLGREVVLREDGTRFWEFDPYYHVWRVFQTLRDFPHVPVFDAAMNHPKGATVIWPPLYDFGIAASARLLGHGPDDARGVERVAAHVPPLLGALTVVPLLFLARRLLGAGAWPWMACALFVASPIHMWYSRLGFVDHHVAVTLAQVLMLLAFLWALRPDAPAGARSRLARAVLATLALSAGFLIWNGFVFFVFILDVGLLAVMFVERARADSPVWRLMCFTHALGALVLVPSVRDVVAASGRPFSPLTLSWLSVTALCAAALVAALEGARRTLLARLPAPARRVVLGAACALLAGAVAVNLPRLGQGFEWLLASDRFMASVVESGSSLVTNGVVDLSHPYAWLSGFFFATPVALLLLARELQASGWEDRGRVVLLAAGTLLFAMAVLQRRFAEPFAPLQAILAAYLLRRLQARLAASAGQAPAGEGRSRQERRRAQRKAAEPATARSTAGSAALVPSAVVGLAVLVAYAGSPGGYAGALEADTRYNTETYDDLQRFAGWLDARSGSTAPGVPRPEGALSLWDLGHRILYLTHLPVVDNNFGLHIGLDAWRDSAAFFVEQDEARALAALEARRVRYVVADYDLATAQLLVGYVEGQPADYFESVKDGSGTATLMKPAFTRTMYFRLGSSHMGSQGTSRYPDGSELKIEPLQHFRLVLETEVKDAVRPLRVFERVAGAQLRVRGAPAEGLRASYLWRSPAGREHRYRVVLAASAGAATAVLPYSSERPELGQSAEYRLEAPDGRWLALRVTEADVQSGRALEADWSAAQAAPPAEASP